MKSNVVAFAPRKQKSILNEIYNDFEYLMDTYNYREHLIGLSDDIPSFGDATLHQGLVGNLVKQCLDNIFIPIAHTSSIEPLDDISDVMEELLEDTFYILSCIKHWYFIMEKYSQVVGYVYDYDIELALLQQQSLVSNGKFYDRSFEDKLWFCFEKDFIIQKGGIGLVERCMFEGSDYDGCEDIEGYLWRLGELLRRISLTVGQINLVSHDIHTQIIQLKDLELSMDKKFAMVGKAMELREMVLDDKKTLDYQALVDLYYIAINN